MVKIFVIQIINMVFFKIVFRKENFEKDRLESKKMSCLRRLLGGAELVAPFLVFLEIVVRNRSVDFLHCSKEVFKRHW